MYEEAEYLKPILDTTGLPLFLFDLPQGCKIVTSPDEAMTFVTNDEPRSEPNNATAGKREVYTCLMPDGRHLQYVVAGYWIIMDVWSAARGDVIDLNIRLQNVTIGGEKWLRNLSSHPETNREGLKHLTILSDLDFQPYSLRYNFSRHYYMLKTLLFSSKLRTGYSSQDGQTNQFTSKKGDDLTTVLVETARHAKGTADSAGRDAGTDTQALTAQ
ncbi:hypothetical protein F4779DRAFT_621268 [Xylariaceae sp. FL0662B]|nr:hypothetical protein F4779DRAFT_621268 [Xylariaceae sp. FL0662B]